MSRFHIVVITYILHVCEHGLVTTIGLTPLFMWQDPVDNNYPRHW